jgi:hypothetical protein
MQSNDAPHSDDRRAVRAAAWLHFRTFKACPKDLSSEARAKPTRLAMPGRCTDGGEEAACSTLGAASSSRSSAGRRRKRLTERTLKPTSMYQVELASIANV